MSTDGRTARAIRTRDAALDALDALIREGTADPGARHIAERAGISTRSVFAHFATMEDLHAALAARVRERVVGLVHPIDPLSPLAGRIADMCAQRGRIAEDVGSFRRAAAAKAETSPVIAAARREARRASIGQIERVFAAELEPLDAPDRARRVAAVDGLLSGETWDLLRTSHDLSPATATEATTAAVTAVLAAAPAAAAPGGDRTATDRRAEAEIILADVEARIARLVAAVEAGAPPDAIARRLADLAAARDAAQGALEGRPPRPADDPGDGGRRRRHPPGADSDMG
jgi:AcrR family transcriptional regulator